MRTKIHPLPEIIEPSKTWIVGEGRPRVDLTTATMYTPVGESLEERHSRLHELAHAQWTPATTPDKLALKWGVSPHTVQLIEDARINSGLSRLLHKSAGVPLGWTDEQVKHTRENIDRAEARMPGEQLAAAVAFLGLCEHSKIVEDMPDYCRNAAAQVNHMLRPKRGKIVATTAQCAEAARYLQSVFDRITLSQDRTPPKTGTGGDAGAPGATPSPGDEAGDELMESAADATRWGTLAVVWTPELTQIVRSPLLIPRPRPSTHGSRLLRLHRLYLDQMVSEQRRRIPGGTILIDVSGSMSLSAADLDSILSTVPAATVAVYSGQLPGGKCGRMHWGPHEAAPCDLPCDSGHITIIAKNGKRISASALESAHWPGGNVIDGPALNWLARNTAPRIWLCDGAVTGRGDQPSNALASEARLLVRRHSIYQAWGVDYVQHAIASARNHGPIDTSSIR